MIFSDSGTGVFGNLFSVLILAAVSAGLVETAMIFTDFLSPYVSEAGLFKLDLLFAVLILFALCPVVYGFFKRMIYVSEGKTPSAAVMFRPFSSRRDLMMSYRLFFVFAAWGLCVWGAFYLAFDTPMLDNMYGSSYLIRFAQSLGFGKTADMLYDAMHGFVRIVLVLLSALTLERILCTFYLTARGLSDTVGKAYRESGKILKGKRFELLAIFLSFTPWLILSFFTAGIVFAVFVFPYMTLTVTMFFRYAERRYTFESGSSLTAEAFLSEADEEYLSEDTDGEFENGDNSVTRRIEAQNK